ncbi:11251_t:CDS:1, partial [Gigaspora rosea]
KVKRAPSPNQCLALFHRVEINIIDLLPSMPWLNNYIVIDPTICQVAEAHAISKANAKEVTKFIYKEIICQHKCPSILLSDQGSHF